MKFHFTLLAVAALISANPASAAAPPALLGKTIDVSFGMFVPGIGPDGSVHRGGRSVEWTIYISSAGRIFAKGVARNRHGYGGDRELSPGRGTFHFAGSTLIGTAQHGNHAAQLRVSFDGSFQSCTANVLVGGENGAPMAWNSLSGKRFTQTGRPEVSAVTCSIANGNAFAN